MARASAGQSSIARVVQLLSAFTPDVASLTITQLASRSGLPMATVHRIVTELEHLRLLEREPNRSLRVGVRLWELASRAPAALRLREAAMPFMEDLHAAVRQHTQLGILDGTDVLFIERLSARNAVVTVTQIGGRLPLHASSAGLVLLAHASSALRDEILMAPLERFTPHTIVRPSEVRQELEDVRVQGYIICNGFLHVDASGIAVPVYGPKQRVVAALSLIVPSVGIEAHVYIPALQAAARGISRTMGARLPAVL